MVSSLSEYAASRTQPPSVAQILSQGPDVELACWPHAAIIDTPVAQIATNAGITDLSFIYMSCLSILVLFLLISPPNNWARVAGHIAMPLCLSVPIVV